MRLVLVTQNAPVYLGTFVDATAARLIEAGHEIVGIVAFSPTFKKTVWQSVRQRLAFYGPVDFTRMSTLIAWNQALAKLASRWPSLGCFSIANARHRHKIPAINVRSVNSARFRRLVIDERVDVVLSLASPQIFKKRLLATPTLGCVNYHMGMLPRYRGRQPLFWALLNKEQSVGLTVHRMDPEIDNGPIIAQKEIAVAPNDSLHSLYTKCIGSGPALVTEAINHLASGGEAKLPNDATLATYGGFPEARDVKMFRARGNRFF